MSLANALNLLRLMLPFYVALTKLDILHLDQHTFEYRPHPAAPQMALDMAKAVFAMGASACTEAYVMSRMLREARRFSLSMP